MVDAIRPGRQVSALEPWPCLAASAGRPIAALVDRMLAMYVDWRESTDAVADTYGRWCVAPAVQ
jgi:hypothetical protein